MVEEVLEEEAGEEGEVLLEEEAEAEEEEVSLEFVNLPRKILSNIPHPVRNGFTRETVSRVDNLFA